LKSNLTRHLKKGRCNSKNDNIAIYERELNIDPNVCEDNLTCRFCKQTYTKQSALSRHKSRGCHARSKYELKLQKEVLERRHKAGEQKIYNNTNIHGDQNNTINIIMPAMNAFGNENLDYITTKFLKKELEKLQVKKGDITSIIQKFTKLIHANPAHPENHNVIFKSLNSGYAEVYDGNDFESRPSFEVQDKIIQNVGFLVGPVADKTVNTSIGQVLEDMDDKMYNANENREEGMVSRDWSQCRQAVKSTLYSNKEQINSTQRLLL
jgi:hypothetical protein